MSFTEAEGNLASILHCLTDQCISTSKQQSLLDAWWIVADYVNHEFHVLWFLDVSVLNRYITRHHKKSGKKSTKLQNQTCGQ